MNVISFPSLTNVRFSCVRTRHAHTHTHTHVFWGSCWTALKVPLFSLLFFAATARTKKIRERRKRETERKILGESWNPRLETRANKPRLRLQTSRLNAVLPRSVNRGFTNDHVRWKKKRKKKKILACNVLLYRLEYRHYRQPVSGYT